MPSSLELIHIQDSLPLIPAGQFYVTSPVTILKEAISPVLNDYDFVLVDCPPNLGIITLNRIFISDYYLIPCIPDILSTYGIPQILGRVDNFKRETKSDISLFVRTAESADFNASVNTLKQKYGSGTAFNDYQNLTAEFLSYV